MYTGCVEWPPFRSVPVLSAITQVSWSKSVTLLPVTADGCCASLGIGHMREPLIPIVRQAFNVHRNRL